MDWKSYYLNRLMSSDEAIGLIKDNDKVVFAHDVGEPPALVEALVRNAKRFRSVEISHMFTLGSGAYSWPEYKDNFHLNAWFVSGPIRDNISRGRGDYTPMYFHETPSLIREGTIGVDVALIMVTPPDERGKVSMGVSCDYTVQAVKTAKTVIAQVNDRVPFTYGEAVLNVCDIDAFVEFNQPLPVLPPAQIGEIESRIGKNCASIIDDGACLQLGIGSIPDAVCHELVHKKHLGIHSEMLGDGVVKLYEEGAIDNSLKQIDKGKFVFNFVMGSQKLYDFCDKNDTCMLMPVDYVNDPRVICRNDNVVSINGGLAVDFYGQVAADTIGYTQFSGVGGQVDFIRGAAWSKNGKSIIAMPSVTVKKDGTKISKICPLLSEGSVVATSRHDVDYIATEYGIPVINKRVSVTPISLIAAASKDKDYVNSKGFDVIKSHAYDFIVKRLLPCGLANDGKQTPMRGHPVFIAQHATATCCRGCLYKWHHISKDKDLTQEQVDYIVLVIMRWIEKEVKL